MTLCVKVYILIPILQHRNYKSVRLSDLPWATWLSEVAQRAAMLHNSVSGEQ